MAPKIQYDAANMQIQADATAEKEIQIVIQDGVRLPPSAEVSCEYLGVLKDDGFTLDARPTLRSTVGYKWSYRDDAYDITQTKKARYDYAAEHGASSPEQWKIALKVQAATRDRT